MPYRLGLDIGTNSIGWCLLDLQENGEPRRIRPRGLGVRLFPDGRDPQTKASLSADRRLARAMRRRRDRYVRRRSALMNTLVSLGLMPTDQAVRKDLEKTLDPYVLRGEALFRPLAPHELGRVLFHLHQRRGFKSNRRTDGDGDGEESGKIKAGIAQLRQEMAAANAPTLGAFLARRHAARQAVRVRLTGTGAKASYGFYPDRKLVEDEFDAVRAAQAHHHPALTPEAWERLRTVIFRQRPLKPVNPGRCTLVPDDPRAPWALPVAQQFRILTELANLRIVRIGQPARPLSAKERRALFEVLASQGEVKFTKMHKLLRLDPAEMFNLEDAKRDRLKGDAVAEALAKKGRFGPVWRTLPLERQTGIVERILVAEEDEALMAWLVADAGLAVEAAGRVAATGLPRGYCRLGRTALDKIVPEMRDNGLNYAEAAKAAGLHHSDLRPDGQLPELPAYPEVLERFLAGGGTGDPEDPPEERFGRLANPTVHIGLNQVRTVVNALIEEHGRPHEIVVELARDLKNSLEDRQSLQREQAANQRKNDMRREKLRDLGLEPTGDLLMRLRLWEELAPEPHDRRCVYTGETITPKQLFSAEVDVDHILPFSRTLDDSPANRIVCFRAANRVKRNRAPFEAFGSSPAPYRWDDILARAEKLPKNKRWRFAPDALDRFATESDFLARHLNETRYLARLARQYLGVVCHPDRVRVVPGRLTALLRGRWGLNSLLGDGNRKNRSDQRHHAIDAVVVAMTDQSLIQRVQTAAGRAEDLDLDRLLEGWGEPWEGFRNQIDDRLRRVVVSYKPDHGWQGRLHNDTAYGPRGEADADGITPVAYRKPLVDLREGEIDDIVDAALQAHLRGHLAETLAGGETFKAALQSFGQKTGVRRVRLHEKLGRPIPVRDARDRVYKLYKGDSNFCYDLFALPGGRWLGTIVSSFAAARTQGASTAPPPGAAPVMRLCKDDMVALGSGAERRLMRVVKFSEGKIVLAEHFEGGDLKKRDETTRQAKKQGIEPEDGFSYLTVSPDRLRQMGGRRVTVSPTGRVRDPGPPG